MRGATSRSQGIACGGCKCRRRKSGGERPTPASGWASRRRKRWLLRARAAPSGNRRRKDRRCPGDRSVRTERGCGNRAEAAVEAPGGFRRGSGKRCGPSGGAQQPTCALIRCAACSGISTQPHSVARVLSRQANSIIAHYFARVLSVQAGELILPVPLDTGRSSDLAAGGDGNRTRCYHNEIRDAESVQVGYRKGDFTFDDLEFINGLFVGVGAGLELDDGDELFGVLIRNRDRRATSRRDALNRCLEVVGRVVTPIHDQKILDTADDEQLAVGDEAQVSGSQPRAFGGAGRRSDKRCVERLLRLFGFLPITG